MPPVLEKHAVEWTQEYLADRTKTPWRHPDIRAGLRQETYGFCAYCESAIEAVAYSHVEHVRPKSKFPDLVVEWNNLTLACPRCNQQKGDFHSDEQPLLDPYQDDPAEHLQFIAGLVRVRNASDRGEVTIRRLRLHRPELVQRRHRRVETVELLVQAWHRAPDALKLVLHEQIWEEADSGNEYTATVAEYLQTINFPARCPRSA